MAGRASPVGSKRPLMLLAAVGGAIGLFGIFFNTSAAFGACTAASSEVVYSQPSFSFSSASGVDWDNPKAYWAHFMQQSQQMLSEHKRSGSNELPACLRPDTAATLELVETKGYAKTKKLLLPAVNMGFPKCGSTSMTGFFGCAGYKASHQFVSELRFSQNDWEGVCMRDAVNLNLPPISSCCQGKDALLEMDVSYPFLYKRSASFDRVSRDECFWPQLSILPQMYADVPDATYLLMFRPVKDWIRSAVNYRAKMNRIRVCNLPNLPVNVPNDLNNTHEVTESLTEFWCSHVLHVRQFVKDHPSVNLLEMDLYDPNRTSYVLSSMFPLLNKKRPANSTAADHILDTTESSRRCWGHANANKKIANKKE